MLKLVVALRGSALNFRHSATKSESFEHSDEFLTTAVRFCSNRATIIAKSSHSKHVANSYILQQNDLK